ncbi:hypothetical protein LBMAG56_24320 [Verrucomicrobiota bacterium]|nr:hypothetical protein LBMAG56_24320 [Verrucomicrobiota bacterium]
MFVLVAFLSGADSGKAAARKESGMRFHTWYMINCEEESTWPADFKGIKAIGFDCVTLWNVIPAEGGWWDLTEIVRNVPMTKRAIQAAHDAGLKVFLGIWNPTNMGLVEQRHRPLTNKGATPNRPNFYSETWQREFWVPFLEGVKREFGPCPGYTGIVFDDATACSDDASIIYSYTPEDEKRYSDFLEKSYGSIASFNLQYRRNANPYQSFAEIKPPQSPVESAKAWKDWMLARGEWSRVFAALTRKSIGREAEIIYIDYDYYLDRSYLTFGHNTAKMVESFDRFGPYIAQEFLRMPEADLLTHIKRVIAGEKEVCPPQKLHFCTWVNGLYKFEPMPKELVRKVVSTIAGEGIHDITLYAYKVHDWRPKGPGRGGKLNRPPLKEISFKYNPQMVAALTEVIAESRAR